MDRVMGKLRQYRAVAGFQCPAEFWPAMEYEGEARFVAIFWEPGGDEACWADGREMVVGAGWGAYLALLDANFDWGHPAYTMLGSSETRATHWLVIDRMTEWAWLVPVEDAEAVLQRQWPLREAAPLPGDSMADWLAMLRRQAARFRPLLAEEIERPMAEGLRRYDVLVATLEGRREKQAD